MNVFFDTEFTGLVPGTTLISLGMISEYGDKFYAEFTDYDEHLVTDWIRDNVISNLRVNLYTLPKDYKANITDAALFEEYIVGPSDYIRDAALEWLLCILCAEECEVIQQKNQQEKYVPFIQFVGDVCHYDFVLLCNLFGGAINMPRNINPVCYDICQDLCPRAEYDSKMPNFMHNEENYWFPDLHYMPNAFEVSRESICKILNGKVPDGNKHNALYDAEVTKMIYEGMRKNKELVEENADDV